MVKTYESAANFPRVSSGRSIRSMFSAPSHRPQRRLDCSESSYHFWGSTAHGRASLCHHTLDSSSSPCSVYHTTHKLLLHSTQPRCWHRSLTFYNTICYPCFAEALHRYPAPVRVSFSLLPPRTSSKSMSSSVCDSQSFRVRI